MLDGLTAAVPFGPDQPLRFLAAWTGVQPDADLLPAEAEGLHPALARWHGVADAFEFSCVQNEICSEQRLHEDGVTVVAVENQEVMLWGVCDSGGNPGVLYRNNDRGEPWIELGEPLDVFLWRFTLMEAVFGAQHVLTTGGMSSERFEALTADFTPVWSDGDGREALLCTDHVLALVAFADGELQARTDGTDAGRPIVEMALFAARTADALATLDGAGVAWDHDSRR